MIQGAPVDDDSEVVSSKSMTVTEVTGLIQLFNSSLLAMEGRLVAKMDEHAKFSSDRWEKHDKESSKLLSDLEIRFTTIESTLKNHIVEAQNHWNKEHDEELILDARVAPVKKTVLYIAKNWRTILLIIVSVLAILGFSGETLDRIVK